MRHLILLSLCIGIFSACNSYLPQDLDLPDNVNITEDRDYITFTPANETFASTGIIFYPGAFVDPHAYNELLAKLASEHNGYKIIMPKMPANLAILDLKAAFDIIEDNAELEQWVIAGHSLGAAMACAAVKESPESFKGLVLLAGYPAASADLSSWNGSALSIFADNDKFATPDNIETSKKLLPTALDVTTVQEIPSTPIGQTIYYNVAGGNHANFASYGEQKNDGVATISRAAQQSATIDIISELFTQNNWN